MQKKSYLRDLIKMTVKYCNIVRQMAVSVMIPIVGRSGRGFDSHTAG